MSRTNHINFLMLLLKGEKEIRKQEGVKILLIRLH
jgi:hypothetical protein